MLRIFAFLFLCIVYIAFWLNVSILFSVRFKQATTSAISALAIWLFFSLFYQIIVNVIAKNIIKPESAASSGMDRQTRNDLEYDAAVTELSVYGIDDDVLSPSVRSLGPLTMEQTAGAIVYAAAIKPEPCSFGRTSPGSSLRRQSVSPLPIYGSCGKIFARINARYGLIRELRCLSY